MSSKIWIIDPKTPVLNATNPAEWTDVVYKAIGHHHAFRNVISLGVTPFFELPPRANDKRVIDAVSLRKYPSSAGTQADVESPIDLTPAGLAQLTLDDTAIADRNKSRGQQFVQLTQILEMSFISAGIAAKAEKDPSYAISKAVETADPYAFFTALMKAAGVVSNTGVSTCLHSYVTITMETGG